MFELSENQATNAVIKVIGVGGCGGTAIDHMIDAGIDGVEFICANTDAQALRNSKAKILLQLGREITKGLGAGADPEVGRLSAEESRDRIIDALSGADMVFIACGMGGGTGTGAAPIVAEIAKDLGILTVAVITRPFKLEGKRRSAVAAAGTQSLVANVNSLITVPNDKLLTAFDKNMSIPDAFKAANDILLGAVQGIADIITKRGYINVDFADVRTVMTKMGKAMMGSGSASGEHRAVEAAKAAISSPLLEDVDLTGAGGLLVNITGGSSLSIGEFEEVCEVFESFTSENATVVIGTVIDPDMGEDIRVTVVVTGLGGHFEEPMLALKSKVIETTKMDGTLDYQKLERPTVMRNQPQDINSTSSAELAKNMDYLDIPAFLRRQEEE